MARIADGTRAGYVVGWKQWLLFRQQQGKQPFLEGRTREGRAEDEDGLLTFAVFLARVIGPAESTVKQRLFAIRFAHMTMGLDDPLP